MSGLKLAQLRPVPGTGRSITSGSGSSVADTVAMGPQTFACLLSATTFPVVVTISQGGANAATATQDVLINTGVAPLVLACAPGDKICAYGIGGAGVLYLTELSY